MPEICKGSCNSFKGFFKVALRGCLKVPLRVLRVRVGIRVESFIKVSGDNDSRLQVFGFKVWSGDRHSLPFLQDNMFLW